VLDHLSVEDALRILGASNTGPSQATAHSPQPTTEPQPADWRAALRAAGAAPGTPRSSGDTPRRASSLGIPASTPEVGGELAPLGIVVGATSRDLFGAGGPSLDSIDALEKAIATCTRCPLSATAKNPVPGEGNPQAELMLVGEAPGATEDETGRRYPEFFRINFSRCIFCGYCEEACPVGAVFMGKDYELAVYSKDDFVWDKRDLLVPASTAPTAARGSASRSRSRSRRPRADGCSTRTRRRRARASSSSCPFASASSRSAVRRRGVRRSSPAPGPRRRRPERPRRSAGRDPRAP